MQTHGMTKQQQHQAKIDSIYMITNRCMDVVIMFLSVFFIIYFFNGNFGRAVLCLATDCVAIPVNNGPQVYRSLHQKYYQWKHGDLSNGKKG